MVMTIFFNVRMPRVLLVFLVGGVLSISGAALQAVFRNPLVSPYILGLSSGAAFGAALAVALAVPYWPIQLSAFVFGLLAVIISYFMALKNKTLSVVTLILAGIIVNGIFTALLTIVQYLSDPFKLQSIVQWTMGNFQNASWAQLARSCIPMLVGILVLLLMRWRLNVLALGDEEARSAGLHPLREKSIVLLLVSLAVSAAVAVSGVISLYGLIVPHIVRMAAGVDNQKALPLNLLFGGTFLLLIDNISRSLTEMEIPIGIFTMLLGAPIFIYLMKKTNIGWER
jgi:iron complex transport system permease protein